MREKIIPLLQNESAGWWALSSHMGLLHLLHVRLEMEMLGGLSSRLWLLRSVVPVQRNNINNEKAHTKTQTCKSARKWKKTFTLFFYLFRCITFVFRKKVEAKRSIIKLLSWMYLLSYLIERTQTHKCTCSADLKFSIGVTNAHWLQQHIASTQEFIEWFYDFLRRV